MQLAGHQMRFSGRFRQRLSASLDRRINAGTHEVSSSPSQSQKTDPTQIRIRDQNAPRISELPSGGAHCTCQTRAGWGVGQQVTDS